MMCKVSHVSETHLKDVEGPGFENTKIGWLIAERDGAPNFAMRLFEMQPGGHTARHSHDWEHEIFILEGQCSVYCDGKSVKASPETAVYVPPNADHNFRNITDSPLRSLCLIPNKR